MKKNALIILMILISSISFANSGDDLFDSAEKRFKSGNYDLALEDYETLINKFPLSDNISDSQFRRACCLFKLGQQNESLRIFKRVKSRYQFTKFIKYIDFWLGVNYYSLQQYNDASQSLGLYLESEVDTFVKDALLYKSFSDYKLNRFEDALSSANKLFDIGIDLTSEPEALTMICAIYLNDKEYANIISNIEDIELNNLNKNYQHKILLYKAEAFFNLNNLEDAEPIYRTLLYSDDEKIGEISIQRLFSIYRAQKKYDKMGELLSEAEQKSPEIVEALWMKYGVEKFKLGYYSDAINYFSKIWSKVNIQDIDDLVVLYYAESFAKSGNIEKAQSILFQYKSYSKSNRSQILLKYAIYNSQLSNWEKCSSTLDSYINDYPNSAEIEKAKYLSIFCDYKLNNFDSAIIKIKEADENRFSFINDTEYLSLKVSIFEKTGDTSMSIIALEEYLEKSPDDSKAWMNLVKQYFSAKNYSKVIELTDIDDDLAKYVRSLCFISLKDYESAKELLADLDISDSLYYRAWVEYRLSSYNSAYDLFMSYAKDNKDGYFYDKALYFAAWSKYSLEEFEYAAESFSDYAKVVDGLDRDNGYLMAGKSYMAAKKFAKAEDKFSKVIKTGDKSLVDDALYENSLQFKMVDDLYSATAELTKIVENHKDSELREDALFTSAEYNLQMDKTEAANEQYLRYVAEYNGGRNIAAAKYKAAITSKVDTQKISLLNDLISDKIYGGDAVLELAKTYMVKKEWSEAEYYYNLLKENYLGHAKANNVDAQLAKLFFLNMGYSGKEATLSADIKNFGGIETTKGRESILKLAEYRLEKDDKIDVAFYDIEKVIDKNIDNLALAYFLQGEYYAKQSEYQNSSQAYYQAALNQYSESDKALYWAGKTSLLDNREDDAKRFFDKLLELYPESDWTKKAKKEL